MAEYIEREALLSELQEEIDFETSMYTEEQNKYFNMGLKCAVRDVKSQPTADVVPKSEYDLLKKSFYELTREARGYLNRIYGIRADVAREIFEEIESLLAIYTYEDNYGEYISTGLADEFAELKKKYTEEKE